jgi:hypothetical protein
LDLAYATYSNDMKDRLPPGYMVWDWAHPGPLANLPPDDAGRLLEGYSVKRYPWRLMPWLDYDFRGMLHDPRMYSDIYALPRAPGAPGSVINPDDLDPQGFELAVSESPSFGINGTFVGGDWGRGAFRSVNARHYGHYYITKLSEASFGSRVMVFGSARGTAAWSPTIVQPGFYNITSPFTTTGLAYGWLPSDSDPGDVVHWTTTPLIGFNRVKWDPTLPPDVTGNLDFRHIGDVAVAAFLDGHVKPITLPEARDMRLWADQATGRDWRPVFRP